MTKKEMRKRGYSVSFLLPLSEMDDLLCAIDSWIDANMGPDPTEKEIRIRALQKTIELRIEEAEASLRGQK